MTNSGNDFSNVGDVEDVVVDIPHADKEGVDKYERHHKYGHNHIDRSERHKNSKHIGGKFKKDHRSDRTHSFRKKKRSNFDDGIRVEKKIADLMECPKEQITKLINEGKVKVNNIVVKDLSLRVGFDDIIHVNNKLISNKRIQLKVYLFNKPKGYIVSNNDPDGRPIIFDIIPSKLGKLIAVGRLDFNSEGLMLLTNSGDYARMMELPKTGVRRVYRVRVFGNFDIRVFEKLKDEGIEIDGIKYGKVVVTEEKLGKEDSANRWLIITIYEGKNREIRKIMEHFGLQVNRLIRLSYGKYNLGTLPLGCAMEVKPITYHNEEWHDDGNKKYNLKNRKKGRPFLGS